MAPEGFQGTWDELRALFAARHAEAVVIDGRRVYFILVVAIGDDLGQPHHRSANPTSIVHRQVDKTPQPLPRRPRLWTCPVTGC
jgi:hypothetical protein